MAVTELFFHIRSSASSVATEDAPRVESSPVDVHNTSTSNWVTTYVVPSPSHCITDRTATLLGKLDPENKGTTIFDKSGWIFSRSVLTALNLAVLHPSNELND